MKKLFFRKDLKLPLIFVLFLKRKQNKKENPKCDSLFGKDNLWKTKVWSGGQVTYCKGMVKNCSTPLSPILDPQFCPSTLAFILGVSHAPNFFRMAPPWPSFGLDRFSSLV